jgi:hypothetical protein
MSKTPRFRDRFDAARSPLKPAEPRSVAEIQAEIRLERYRAKNLSEQAKQLDAYQKLADAGKWNLSLQETVLLKAILKKYQEDPELFGQSLSSDELKLLRSMFKSFEAELESEDVLNEMMSAQELKDRVHQILGSQPELSSQFPIGSLLIMSDSFEPLSEIECRVDGIDPEILKDLYRSYFTRITLNLSNIGLNFEQQRLEERRAQDISMVRRKALGYEIDQDYQEEIEKQVSIENQFFFQYHDKSVIMIVHVDSSKDVIIGFELNVPNDASFTPFELALRKNITIDKSSLFLNKVILDSCTADDPTFTILVRTEKLKALMDRDEELSKMISDCDYSLVPLDLEGGISVVACQTDDILAAMISYISLGEFQYEYQIIAGYMTLSLESVEAGIRNGDTIQIYAPHLLPDLVLQNSEEDDDLKLKLEDYLPYDIEEEIEDDPNSFVSLAPNSP